MSGIPAGTLFALGTTGWLITRFRWPSVFYIFGTAGLIWTAIWCERTIWSAKRSLARAPGGGDTAGLAVAAKGPIPWRRLLTQPSIWGVVVGHFCTNWILYVFMAWLPSYLHTVQRVFTETCQK
jgi:ACS family sodium-dependent inorganic phosphate cotransporter